MDWQGWLDAVAAIEADNPHRRIVWVSFPGGLPEAGCNVENTLYRGMTREKPNVPGMRAGIYGAFPVVDGAFGVRFNDGQTVTE